ncbi:hypothetical protein ACXWRL_09320, partial [Streptococcus pyogenes]
DNGSEFESSKKRSSIFNGSPRCNATSSAVLIGTGIASSGMNDTNWVGLPITLHELLNQSINASPSFVFVELSSIGQRMKYFWSFS